MALEKSRADCMQGTIIKATPSPSAAPFLLRPAEGLRDARAFVALLIRFLKGGVQVKPAARRTPLDLVGSANYLKDIVGQV